MWEELLLGAQPQYLFPRRPVGDVTTFLIIMADGTAGRNIAGAVTGQRFYVKEWSMRNRSAGNINCYLASDPTAATRRQMDVQQYLVATTGQQEQVYVEGLAGDSGEAVGVFTDAAGEVEVRISGYYHSA